MPIFAPFNQPQIQPSAPCRNLEGDPPFPSAIEVDLLPLKPGEHRWSFENNGELITLYFLTIDTKRAKAMLSINTRNRNFKSNQIDRYSRDLMEGQWSWNGATICVSGGDHPVLLDGQNRLRAVLETGCSMQSLVVVGLRLEAQDNMDTGSKRSFNDILKIAGEKNCNDLAALVNLDLRYSRGELAYQSRYQATASELQKHLDENPDIRDVLSFAQPAIRKFGIPKSHANLAALLFYRIDPNDCADFWNQLSTPQTARDVPIKVLQDALLRKQVEDRKGKKTNPLIKLAYVIKAWNAYRNGEKPDHYKYTIGGANPMSFPEPI